MGVDCKAYLNPIAPIEDVLKVCGILHGVEKKIRTIEPQNRTEKAFDVVDLFPGLRIRPGSLSKTDKDGFMNNFDGFLTIEINSMTHLNHRFSLHMHSNPLGQTLYYAKSNPKNVALGKKLVEIFGGKLIAQDSSDKVQLTVKKGIFRQFIPDDDTDSDANEKYHAKEIFFKELNPLSPDEILSARKIAGYELEEKDFSEMIMHYQSYQALIMAKHLDEVLPDKPGNLKKAKI